MAKTPITGLTDRIAGALLGVACGDALGATREFAGPNSGAPHRDIVGGGPFGWRPGQPTDDTDQTWIVVRAYLALDPSVPVAERVARELIEWFHGGPQDIGTTTRRALARLAQGVPWQEAGPRDALSAGNGSLMRCIPTGLVRARLGDRHRESREISSITHAEPRAIDACVAYNDIVNALIEGVTPEAAVAEALEPELHREVRRALQDAAAAAEMGAPLPFDPGGFVLTSLQIAAWALLTPRPAEELLIAIADAGGDADTNCAIAGGLLGARDGLSAWPQRWVDQLESGPQFLVASPRLAAIRLRS